METSSGGEVKEQEHEQEEGDLEQREVEQGETSKSEVKLDSVLQILSAFSANQSYSALMGILNWASLEFTKLKSEFDYTNFSRAVFSRYKALLFENPSRLRGAILNARERTILLLAFLYAIKPEYRNAWMQLLLQGIGCFEIASKTFKIQGEVYKADPKLFEDLKHALLNSVKPELKDEVLAIIDSVSSFLKRA
jgi:hypothetical protein